MPTGIRGEKGVGCAGRRIHFIAFFVDHEFGVRTTSANIPDITDVVTQQGNREVQPIVRRDVAVFDVFAL